MGEGSKINHLSYIGDTSIGADVNIGAGTITCNYDGANKHRTIIGDRVFIGSDSQLVAPVEIQEGATIGAGCTIGPGIRLGQYSMIGMGSVVTNDVGPFRLVYGNPARSKGIVCICGGILAKYDEEPIATAQAFICPKCNRKYRCEAYGSIKLATDRTSHEASTR